MICVWEYLHNICGLLMCVGSRCQNTAYLSGSGQGGEAVVPRSLDVLDEGSVTGKIVGADPWTGRGGGLNGLSFALVQRSGQGLQSI